MELVKYGTRGTGLFCFVGSYVAPVKTRILEQEWNLKIELENIENKAEKYKT